MNDLIKSRIKNILVYIDKNGLTWKPGKDIYHLKKRKARNHIPENWEMKDYIAQIMNILKEEENSIYIYFKDTFEQDYFVFADGSKWIVIIGENGIMETATILDNYDNYLDPSKGYRYIGSLREVLI